MSRNPCETVRQWNARATAAYQECLAAVDAESKRLGLDCWPVRSGEHPLPDAAYEAALDDLDAADDERITAAIALLLDDSVSRVGDPDLQPRTLWPGWCNEPGPVDDAGQLDGGV